MITEKELQQQRIAAMQLKIQEEKVKRKYDRQQDFLSVFCHPNSAICIFPERIRIELDLTSLLTRVHGFQRRT